MTAPAPSIDNDPGGGSARTGRAGSSGTSPIWVGALCGLVAAGAGLGAAELVAAASTSMRSPIVSVGDRVVDNVPAAVKDWAISAFGTNDKIALLSGVGILLALYAALIGVVTLRRSRALGLAGVALFALVGAAASLGRAGGGVLAPVPSIVGGLVAAAVLVGLSALAVRGWPSAGSASPDTAPTDNGPEPSPALASMRALQAGSRRRFLAVAAGVGAAAVLAGLAGRWLGDRAAAAAERLKVVLPRPSEPPAPIPAGVDVGVDGVSSFVTPNRDFYRIDTALVVPSVDVATWTLQVKGMVDRPITMNLDQLLSRPMIVADVTMACVSNEVGGDLIGNARWLGCRLDDLLDEAGIDARADQIVGRSVDGFTAGFPTAVLDGRDAIVAVGMNGEALPTDHGFPARLVVPGLYGYVSATKWLAEIELTRFDEFEGYWIPRGWSVEGPVKTQSRIDTPSAGKGVPAGKALPIAGVAWAPVRGISKVEVSVDDGRTWDEADLGEQFAATTWRQWKYVWTPPQGEHRIKVRATDGTGDTQTGEEATPDPDGATGWHTVRIEAA